MLCWRMYRWIEDITDNAICTDEYQPVCSCNGITYGTDCYAENAGVIVRIEGECD